MTDPKLDPDLALKEDMGRFALDPMGFVMYAYPWDTDPALRVCKLQSPWDLIYGCEYGPDAWACQMLDEIGDQVRKRNFRPLTSPQPVAPIQMAIASGHGIGKSALVAWLVDWIMSTRPHSQGTVTANTGEQLSSKTWAQIGKWTKLCITGHWFEITSGKGAMKMVHKEYPDSWRCTAQTCREENSESFAGQHSATGSSFYIFDEASAVPDKIWEVAEGGLTDGEPMWFAFGNPTRNTGRFADCFGKLRHRWVGRQIDSRNVQITNKNHIQGWVDDYGEDSDFVRVRVRGVFPRAGTSQFIGRDLVDEAMARPLGPGTTHNLTALVGVDVARFGDDESVIRTRMGRDARTFPPLSFRGLDTMQLAARVAAHTNELKTALGFKRVLVFVDGGGVGGGVVDRLRQLGHDCIEVQFGGKPDDPRKYLNKRAEMWGRVKDWLTIGHLAPDEVLATDLTGPEYAFNDAGQIVLEKKEHMKERNLASPDHGDALALTFAYPSMEFMPLEDKAAGGAHTANRATHDPFAKNRLLRVR